MTREEIMREHCPVCTAGPGKPCHQVQAGKAVGWRYKDVKHFHLARKRRAERKVK